MDQTERTAEKRRPAGVPRLAGQLLDAAPSGIIVIDQAGCISLVNRRIEAMFACERAKLVGRHVEDVLPGYSHGRAAVGRRSDGSEFGVEVEVASVEADGAIWHIATVRTSPIEPRSTPATPRSASSSTPSTTAWSSSMPTRFGSPS